VQNQFGDQITATVPEFLRLSGLGNTKTYELISKGELKSVRIGRRRLIILESYRDLIERQQGGSAR
jgi:excisionase family DNA binding protein